MGVDMQGYKRTVPDVEYWVEQIRAGEKWRDDCTSRARWEIWDKYYAGDFKKSVLPKNIFFTMVRTIVPRIYFRNPSVSITPCKPGPAHAVLAKILERIDNKLITMMGMKQTLQMMVQSAYMYGTSPGILGFGALYTPSPDIGVTQAPLSTEGYNLEYRQGMLPNMPWFLDCDLDCFVVPRGIRRMEEARWNVLWTRRPVEEVKDDPRLKNTEDIKGVNNKMSYRLTDMGDVYDPVEYVNLAQVRDLRTGRVFILAPDVTDKVLLDVEDDLQYNNGFPHFPLIFNPQSRKPWGVPDSKILEPFQLEINETKTLTMKHRRISIVKMLVKSGMLKEEQAQRMVSDEVMAIVEVDGDPQTDVRVLEGNNIPQELITHEQMLMQDVREMTGFGRNQFGEYGTGSADRTAHEAEIVKMASEIRVDERRDKVADLLVNVIQHIHNVIFKHWTQQQVIDIVGPMGLPIWVQFTGQMLKAGAYEVKVDPDTSLPETKALREQRAKEFYALASQNPVFDPVKVSSFLLHEHYGVAFDDMIRGAPMAGVMGPVDLPTAIQTFQGMMQMAQQIGGGQQRQLPQGGGGA